MELAKSPDDDESFYEILRQNNDKDFREEPVEKPAVERKPTSNEEKPVKEKPAPVEDTGGIDCRGGRRCNRRS